MGSSPGLVHVGKWTPSLTAWPLVSLWCPGVLLDSSGWLRICNFPAPASQVLGLQVCPTTPSACFMFPWQLAQATVEWPVWNMRIYPIVLVFSIFAKYYFLKLWSLNVSTLKFKTLMSLLGTCGVEPVFKATNFIVRRDSKPALSGKGLKIWGTFRRLWPGDPTEEILKNSNLSRELCKKGKHVL